MSHAEGQQGGRSRGGPPRSAGDLVAGALRDMGVPTRSLNRKIEDAWRQVAEPAWLEHCHLERFDAGVLEIGVGVPALREELENFHRDRIRGLLAVAMPDVPVVALRFRTHAS